MEIKQVDYADFQITIPSDWQDVTESLDDPGAPLTLANPDSGVGALQLSLALYRSGKSPGLTMGDLQNLLDQFASSRGLRSSFAGERFDDGLIGVGCSFQDADDFLRAWYCSDGQSVAFVTYVCAWESRHTESMVIDGMVRSLQFKQSK